MLSLLRRMSLHLHAPTTCFSTEFDISLIRRSRYLGSFLLILQARHFAYKSLESGDAPWAYMDPEPAGLAAYARAVRSRTMLHELSGVARAFSPMPVVAGRRE